MVRKWDTAMALCSMEVSYHQEAILHLTGNKYLVYSPVDITMGKNCAACAAEDKAKQDSANIDVTEIQVPTGCTAQFINHTIIPDSSILLESNIQHFEWIFSGLTSRITPDDIKQALHDTTHNFQFNHLKLAHLIPNINEKQQQGALTQQNHQSYWLPTIAIISIAVAILSFLGFL